ATTQGTQRTDLVGAEKLLPQTPHIGPGATATCTESVKARETRGLCAGTESTEDRAEFVRRRPSTKYRAARKSRTGPGHRQSSSSTGQATADQSHTRQK